MTKIIKSRLASAGNPFLNINSLSWMYKLRRFEKSREAVAIMSSDTNSPAVVAAEPAGNWFEEQRPFQASPGTPLTLFRDEHQRRILDPELRHFLEDRQAARAASEDLANIPATIDREGYYDDRHLAYWLSGLHDYRNISRHVDLIAGDKVLDFGGASGRVARHFSVSHPDVDVIIGDINRNHIDYVNQHLADNVAGVRLSGQPTIPFADKSFKMIYGISVFTHIDVFETSWLAELERVLSPGGVAWLTFHSEHTWKILPSTHLHHAIKNNPAFLNIWNGGDQLPSERLVFSHGRGIEYSCNVFHHTDYIRRIWGKFFGIKEILIGEHGYHAVAVLTKR
ncbi:class I SAM-dependent methyltransferase [Burkholderia lata]|uniref:Methyltransferase type 11 n=1 Tax=Burkholderia lata (strain ATCC 17760 / DSM 23089 / LMG 22485 / NCIMB 9086 / R18194 / 383) TaxID=482957 RepID=A0A6P2HVC8_BURL3|nr:class I SAM-dependent methyltransferase [Burkholderia lata]VWB22177.1 methyltransferase type 11 [Burkholderia lata]